ncbi:MAG: MMPL family transporter, partial [Methylococcus sp.]
SRRLAARLRASPLFESVLNGADAGLLSELEQRLWPYRYALSPAMQEGHFDPPALRAALQQRLAELASPAGVLQKAWLTRDPTGEWSRLLREWLTPEGPALEHGVWSSRDGHRALLLARTRASGFDLDGQSRALETVQAAFAQCFDGQFKATDIGSIAPPPLRLVLGGPGVLGVEANTLITRDATRLSIINSLLVMALLLSVYRSPRVLGLGLIPLVTGVLSGAAATRFAFGGVHGITLGFGATLIGVAADYPNHFFTHLSPHETPVHAMRRIWPTLRLGLLTNVAGFGAMLFSGFPGLTPLAVFAGAGLLAAGLATRWVLPSLPGARVRLPAWVEEGLPRPQAEEPVPTTARRNLPVFSAKHLFATCKALFSASPEGRGARGESLKNRQCGKSALTLNPSPSRRGTCLDTHGITRWPNPRWLPPGITLGLLAAFILSGRPLWNDDIGALNPVPAARQALDASLQQDFSATDLGKLVVITATDSEAALTLSESLMPLLEDLRRQGALSGFDLAARYLPSRASQAARLALLPEPAVLARHLAEARRGLPFKADAFTPFLDDSAAARARGPLRREDIANTWLADRIDSLLTPLPDGHAAALVTLAGIRDEAVIRRALAPWQERGVHFVDLKAETTRLMHDYRQEANRLLAGSLLFILALLTLGLRGLQPAWAVLQPVLAASVSTALIMALASGGLNLYHLVSLLLVMGLSLDQSLFFNRDAADPEERRRTLLSLLVCSLSSILAFGTLALSAINILRAIGATVALGALLAIGFAALLAQPPKVPR